MKPNKTKMEWNGHLVSENISSDEEPYQTFSSPSPPSKKVLPVIHMRSVQKQREKFGSSDLFENPIDGESMRFDPDHLVDFY